MGALESEQERRGGAGEGVDRLRRVAHDADLVAVAQPEVEQALLQRTDVLVLVDHEVPVLAAHRLGCVPAVGEDPDGEQEDVLHVDDAAAALRVLVGAVELSHSGRVEARRRNPAGGDRSLRVLRRRDLADLGPFDLRGQVPDLGLTGPDPDPGRGGRDHRCLRRLDPRQLAADHGRPEVLQLAQRGGVERPCLHAAGAERTQPGAHLPRGPRREGHREHALGRVDPGPDAVRNPVRDRPGLAGPGPGQHADGTLQGLRDLALLRVERVEIVRHYRAPAVMERFSQPELTTPPGLGTAFRAPSTV